MSDRVVSPFVSTREDRLFSSLQVSSKISASPRPVHHHQKENVGNFEGERLSFVVESCGGVENSPVTDTRQKQQQRELSDLVVDLFEKVEDRRDEYSGESVDSDTDEDPTDSDEDAEQDDAESSSRGAQFNPECAECTELQWMFRARGRVEAMQAQRIKELETRLINVEEDNKMYESEYLRVTEEGRLLYTTYASKCNTLKQAQSANAELTKQLEATRLESVTLKASLLDERKSVNEWKNRAKQHGSRLKETLASYRTTKAELESLRGGDSTVARTAVGGDEELAARVESLGITCKLLREENKALSRGGLSEADARMAERAADEAHAALGEVKDELREARADLDSRNALIEELRASLVAECQSTVEVRQDMRRVYSQHKRELERLDEELGREGTYKAKYEALLEEKQSIVARETELRAALDQAKQVDVVSKEAAESIQQVVQVLVQREQHLQEQRRQLDEESARAAADSQEARQAMATFGALRDQLGGAMQRAANAERQSEALRGRAQAAEQQVRGVRCRLGDLEQQVFSARVELQAARDQEASATVALEEQLEAALGSATALRDERAEQLRQIEELMGELEEERQMTASLEESAIEGAEATTLMSEQIEALQSERAELKMLSSKLYEGLKTMEVQTEDRVATVLRELSTKQSEVSTLKKLLASEAAAHAAPAVDSCVVGELTEQNRALQRREQLALAQLEHLMETIECADELRVVMRGEVDAARLRVAKMQCEEQLQQLQRVLDQQTLYINEQKKKSNDTIRLLHSSLTEANEKLQRYI